MEHPVIAILKEADIKYRQDSFNNRILYVTSIISSITLQRLINIGLEEIKISATSPFSPILNLKFSKSIINQEDEL